MYRFSSYRINHGGALTHEGAITSNVLFLADSWEQFSEDGLGQYFNTSFETFLQALTKFRAYKRSLTSHEEKNLKFMLESLIHTKNTLYSNKENM